MNLLKYFTKKELRPLPGGPAPKYKISPRGARGWSNNNGKIS